MEMDCLRLLVQVEEESHPRSWEDQLRLVVVVPEDVIQVTLREPRLLEVVRQETMDLEETDRISLVAVGEEREEILAVRMLVDRVDPES